VCAPPELVTGCWHQPPGEGWKFIPAPVQDPTDCDGPVSVTAPDHVSTLGEKVNEAILRVYGCDGGRCVVTDGRYLVQRKIIDELRRMGLCAGQHQPGTGPTDYGTDEIAVAPSTTAVREGFRVYAGPAVGSGTLILSPQGRAPAWVPSGAPAQQPPPAPPTQPPGPAPPPAPPDGGSCSSPLPPKLWTAATLPPGWGEDQIGRPRWEIGCGPHNNVIDCTAKVAPQACAYCDSIGMGEAGGQIRCGCPVRNECPGVKCEERVACEAYLTGGTRLQTCAEARAADSSVECTPTVAACELVGGNPFMFHPSGGNCRLCSVGDPRVCGGWF
jgi:hypothetical protein